MRIVVDRLYGPVKRQLYLAGWRLDRLRFDGDLGITADISWAERSIGQCMSKQFDSLGDAIREFEAVTGYDVIGETSQDGCPIWTFFCFEERLALAGWECGKYLYNKWEPTPRKCLEAMSA